MNEAFKMCFGQSGMDTKGENQISSESLILCWLILACEDSVAYNTGNKV